MALPWGDVEELQGMCPYIRISVGGIRLASRKKMLDICPETNASNRSQISDVLDARQLVPSRPPSRLLGSALVHN
ncbi:hypothetical protein J6590_012745 [Homalodisca vitripennis]|nr:hypothetical protein J6590_012745 [Homalodisca vitripennis]